MRNSHKTLHPDGVQVTFVLYGDRTRNIWWGNWKLGMLNLWKNPVSGLWEATLYQGENRVDAEGRTMEAAAEAAMYDWHTRFNSKA